MKRDMNLIRLLLLETEGEKPTVSRRVGNRSRFGYIGLPSRL
jgi:hypothetical protein